MSSLENTTNLSKEIINHVSFETPFLEGTKTKFIKTKLHRFNVTKVNKK